MNAVLLPVKAFSRSKQRLAGVLSAAERERLAQTLFEDVWATLRQAQGRAGSFDRLLVVSSEPYVVARCRREDVPCLEEEEQRSHSDSVQLATPWAVHCGVRTLLSVPIDTPAVSAEEIAALFELRDRFAVVVVPSRDGSGTNALLRTPPGAIAPHFGPDSCRLHGQEAEARGLSWSIVRSPGLLADLDAPEDLEEFLSTNHPCRTANLLRRFLNASRRYHGERRHPPGERRRTATCP